jgi:hypothetical protein
MGGPIEGSYGDLVRVRCVGQILREDCERNELRVKEIRGEIEVMQVSEAPTP